MEDIENLEPEPEEPEPMVTDEPEPMETDGPKTGQELRRRSGRKRNTPTTLYEPGDHESKKKRRVIGFSKRKKTATDELEPEPEPYLSYPLH